jgi:hypothetical protein
MIKKLVLMMLVGLVAFHGGVANAEEDFYAPEEGQDNSTAVD